MKKIYAMFCALLAGTAMNAQVDVTFTVDMTGQTVSPNGVHIAGNFNDPDEGGTTYPADYNAAYPNWNPGAIELMDMGGGLYAATLQLLPARYEFKFINNNDWSSGVEDVPGACQVGNGNSNREITIGTDPVDYTICWSSCAACGQKTVRFRVDMSAQPAVSPNGVHVAGDFQGWDPATSELKDPDGNGVYEGYFNVGTASSIEFKYVNGNSWVSGIAESIASGAPCGNSNNDNRTEALTADNTVLTNYCFNQCGSCVLPTAVTFRVDMSLQTVSANGVHLAGAFGDAGYPNWNPGGIALTDAGNNIYETVLNLPPGNYQFKIVNGNDWSGVGNDNESVPAACAFSGNRQVTVGTTAQTVQFCYNQCSEACVVDPPAAPITFYVDMTNTPASAQGVWLIGGFTSPQWQGGAIQMTDMGNNIYSTTVNISGSADILYKFVNGDVNTPANEEDGIADCGIANGVGGYNRTHTRTGQAEILPGPCFNTCTTCFVGVEEQEIVNQLMIFPNPVQDNLNILFNSPVAQDLVVRVINNVGQVVSTQNLMNVNGTRMLNIDMSALSAGIYNIEIQNGQGSVVRRVAVQ